MRKITASQAITFAAILMVGLLASGLFINTIFRRLDFLGSFSPVVATIAFAMTFVALMIAFFRLFCRIRPLPTGEIPAGSPAETTYHVYLLFFLMIFYPIMKSNIVPVPIMRIVYLALGATLGSNTYSGGIIFDPMFVRIGSNTLIGQGALIIPHVIEGDRLAHFAIEIGDQVTIGANAVILSDVSIGDRSVIAIGSVVPKGTQVPAGEIWGGTPARRLGIVDEKTVP